METLYVSDTAIGTGNGSLGSPFASIARAINEFEAQGIQPGHVGLLPGTYRESLSLAASVIIVGATSQGTKSCNPGTAEIRSPLATGLAVSAGQVQLERLTIRATNALDASESSYGLFVSGGSVTVTNAVIIAGAGASALSPALPSAAPLPMMPCQCADGGHGLNGSPGRATPGRFVDAGYLPGDGTSGTRGTNGGNGTPPDSNAGCNSCVPTANCGAIGAPLCEARTPEPGACGCGGIGGQPATPGRGGGASIGVFVSGGSVRLQDTAISASTGGVGESATAPGAPSVATSPVRGTERLCTAGGVCLGLTCGTCGWTLGTTIEGAIGGLGGDGGVGGTSGSGAGGPSIGIVQVSPGVVTRIGGAISTGSGGRGGLGAAMGSSLHRLDVP